MAWAIHQEDLRTSVILLALMDSAVKESQSRPRGFWASAYLTEALRALSDSSRTGMEGIKAERSFSSITDITGHTLQPLDFSNTSVIIYQKGLLMPKAQTQAD